MGKGRVWRLGQTDNQMGNMSNVCQVGSNDQADNDDMMQEAFN